MGDDNNKKEIFYTKNLQAYFFENLKKLNDTSPTPLTEEIIFYSSQVLNIMAESSRFFETLQNGQIREKLLGFKFLDSHHLSKKQQKVELKDIGDTSLCLCGIFNEYLSKKIVDKNYYIKLGETAFAKLNIFEPTLLGVSNFYLLLSQKFEVTVKTLELFARDFFKDPNQIYHIKLQ